MSSRHSAQAAPTGQAILPDGKSFNHRDEFYRLGCILLQMLIAAAQHTATAAIARRVALLANATIIPDSGYVNARGGAAAMDMTESGFKQLADRKKIPIAKPGDERLYRLSDLITKTSPRESKGGAE